MNNGLVHMRVLRWGKGYVLPAVKGEDTFQ